MTTGGFRVTALRVKLPCDDEKDFSARLADTIAEKGLRVPTANLRPVGTRVRVVLEFRNAQTVSGEGIVDAHVEGPRPTMNVRLVKLERSSAPAPSAKPVPTPAPTPPVARAVPTPVPAPAVARAVPTPVPAPAAKPAPMPEVDRTAPTPIPGRGAGRTPTPVPTATPVPEAVAPPKAAPPPPASREAEDLAELVEPDEMLEPSAELEPAAAAPAAAPESSFASILDDALAEPAAPEPEPAPRPPAEGTETLEPLYGTPPDEPTPAPLVAAAPGTGSIPAASRRAALVAVAAASVLGAALLAYAVARRPASPPPDPAAVAADAEAQLGARLAGADRRISEGRLGGKDGALEQLLAAKALRANDARVNDRLRLLADTLEMLGGRALERGNAAEAEVHLSAAQQAAPDRPSISAKLEAAAKMSGAPGKRPDTGAGGLPP